MCDTPLVNFPHESGQGTFLVYSTNIADQIITGSAGPDVKEILVNGSTAGVVFFPMNLALSSEVSSASGVSGITGITGITGVVAGVTGVTGITATTGFGGPSGVTGTTGTSGISGTSGTTGITGGGGVPGTNPGEWYYKVTLKEGENKFQIVAHCNPFSPPATIIIYLVTRQSLNFIINQPSGIELRRYRNKIEVVTASNTEPQLKGYNFYASTLPGGGIDGYIRLNPALVSTPSFLKNEVVDSDETFETVQSEVPATIKSSNGPPYNLHGKDLVLTIDNGTPQTITFIGDGLSTAQVTSQINAVALGFTASDGSVVLTTNSIGSAASILINSGTANNFLGFVVNTLVVGKSQTFKTTTLSEVIEQIAYYSFFHNRSNNENSSPDPTLAFSVFGGINPDVPLYYVITAVGFDVNLFEEYESVFSTELVGLPLIIDTTPRDLVPRDLSSIQIDAIELIRRANPDVSVTPGSDIRDLFIDPFSGEAERIWFILDFSHRTQSFLTLLQVDDGDQDRESDPVSTSPYKLALKAALGFESDDAVQQLIDDAFTKLAGNSDTYRLPAQQAQGSVVFYTNTRPTNDLIVNVGAVVASNADADAGIAANQYEVTSQRVLQASSADSYFNPNTQRYEITANIRALTPGEAGNVPPNAVRSVISGISPELRVVNSLAIDFGSDIESNIRLAERAILAFVGVDAGTEGGYKSTSLKIPGVNRSRIIAAGEVLMQRDYDEVRQKHIGGKVDIWIQGLSEKSADDQFAFTFASLLNELVQLVGSPTNLRFKTTNPLVTVDTPIFAVLNDPTNGFGVRNTTSGEDFDLTNVVVESFDTFKLDTTRPQPAVAVDDVIRADLKYRDSEEFVFTQQPVRGVVSVVGSGSGTLPLESYQLIKTDDPLIEGESTIAKNALRVRQFNGVPTGDRQTITNEPHILIGRTQVDLNNVGVDVSTLVVTDAAGTVTYTTDVSAAPVPDVFVQIPVNNLTEHVKISRNPAGLISNGQSILVNYLAEENFTVTYTINQLLQTVQSRVDVQSHVTADVIVKQSIENLVDLDMTVVTRSDVDVVDVDVDIRSRLTTLFNRLQVGEAVAQSDVIYEVERVQGVRFVVLPMLLFAKADDSLILRDSLDSDAIPVAVGAAKVWLLNEQLEFECTEFGGTELEHKGIFEDEQPLELVSDFSALAQQAGRGMIIGKDGLVIVGVPLDNTKNRILVSTTALETPEDHKYTVSYFVEGESGSKNRITTHQVEALRLGELVIRYTTEETEPSDTF